jgi:hypothetical protein
MRDLILYDDYSREEVHNIFDPDSPFTPQAGTWGLQGIVRLPERPGDFVFFVTFGQRQAEHEFDEGITPEGVLRWQSQPKQALSDRDIQRLIAHDETRNSIYLFLRTASTRARETVPYTYLGRLKYVDHDHERERPVHFIWQIQEWNISSNVVDRMHLQLESNNSPSTPIPPPTPNGELGLIQVATPSPRNRRAGVSTSAYTRRTKFDHAEQDAMNRRLGLAGELAVLECERLQLVASGRQDLADRLLHVAKVEGDGAGYDIRSFTVGGEEKFIEVKTTKGSAQTDFYVSMNEVQFAADHADRYYLYRVFEFNQAIRSGKVFIQRGELSRSFSLKAVQYKAVLAVPYRPPRITCWKHPTSQFGDISGLFTDSRKASPKFALNEGIRRQVATRRPVVGGPDISLWS